MGGQQVGLLGVLEGIITVMLRLVSMATVCSKGCCKFEPREGEEESLGARG